jgi:signal transduction histidine kinase
MIMMSDPRTPLSARLPSGAWLALDAIAGTVACWITAVLGVPDIRSINGVAVFDPDPTGSVLPPLAVSVTVLLGMTLRRLNAVVSYAALLTVPLLSLGAGPASCLFVLPAAYPLYLITTDRRPRESATALLLAVVISAADFKVFSRSTSPSNLDLVGISPFLETVFVMLVLIVVWIAGFTVRQRRLYDVSLREQAAASAIAEERLRIARELHDVCAHTMSVIAVQAGFGRYVIKSRPQEAMEALAAIKTTSGHGLEDLRHMIAALRNQEDEPATELIDLPRLVERARAAGADARLTAHGGVRALPPEVALSASRIITEALTNVVRHAGPGTRCEVRIGYADEDLTVTITDEGGTTPSHRAPDQGGHGLAGMRERAALCGGTLTAGPLPERGFQVSARLPIAKRP